MNQLQKTSADLIGRTRNLALMSEEDIRRFAAEAARDRNADDLWWLTEAHLTLHGSAGSRVSRLTLQNYRRYVRELIEAWSGEALLRPSRNAGVLLIRELEAVSKPATVRVKLAAARALYAALRWSGATTADPFSDAKPGRDLTPAWEKRQAYSLHEVEWLTRVAEGYTLYIVLLGAHAGLRVSEMTALTWEDVDLSEGKLVVKNGKGGKRGAVYLSQTILEALERKKVARKGINSIPEKSLSRKQKADKVVSVADVVSNIGYSDVLVTPEAKAFINKQGLGTATSQALEIANATFHRIRAGLLHVVEGDIEGERYLQLKLKVAMDRGSAREAYHVFHARLDEVLPVEKSILFSVDYIRV